MTRLIGTTKEYDHNMRQSTLEWRSGESPDELHQAKENR